ncbi:PEPKR2, partial [Symbiodinium sp. CCMP2456]
WWELEALLPEGTDLEILFSHYDIEYKEADSEDRLFFDIIATSWPSAERFLQRCRDEGRKVLVNCQAGHNRQRLRGTVLSNHGFRLQLVRLALQLGKLGGVKYGHNSKDFERQPIKKALKEASLIERNSKSVISDEVSGLVSQRKLSLELVACLTHWNKNFLDHYEYTADPPVVVGRGFSGDVVLCQRRNARDFGGRPQNSLRCVKRFNLTSMKPDHLEKLKNEAVIYLSLEHPHIARLFDVYEDDEELSLVMQYCGGGTLQDVLRSKGPFPEPDFKQAAVQMLRVLNYVHRAGIVHRDIKPRNWVYEAERNILKLIDFGFSAKCLMLHEGRGAKIEGSAQLKGCLGTLGYLAPEVISSAASSEAYSEKCDIWSLGVVLLELLRGVCVFERERGGCDGYTEEVILREIQDVSSQDIAKHLDLVPSNARTFLARLLTKEPSSRPSAQDLLEATPWCDGSTDTAAKASSPGLRPCEDPDVVIISERCVETVPCEICGQSVPFDSFLQHMSTHQQGDALDAPEQLRRPDAEIDAGIECEVCGRLVDFDDFAEHMEGHREAASSSSQRSGDMKSCE